MANKVFLFLAFFIFVILVYVFAFRTVAKMSKIGRSLNQNVVTTNTQDSIQNNINVTQNNLANEKKFCSNCGKTCTSTYCTYCGNKNKKVL